MVNFFEAQSSPEKVKKPLQEVEPDALEVSVSVDNPERTPHEERALLKSIVEKLTVALGTKEGT